MIFVILLSGFNVNFISLSARRSKRDLRFKFKKSTPLGSKISLVRAALELTYGEV